MNKTFLMILLAVISLNCKAQPFSKLHAGCYYDTTGTKFSGFVTQANDDHIWYKPNKKDDKVRIPASAMNSFVIGADSFVVSKSPLLANIPFLQVMVNGPAKLYLSKPNPNAANVGMAFGAIGGAISGAVNARKNYGYYFGDTAHELTRLFSKNFIDAMSKVMANKPAVVKKIKDKTYRFDDMYDLIYFYETGTETTRKSGYYEQ
jgi:hypothetical protein